MQLKDTMLTSIDKENIPELTKSVSFPSCRVPLTVLSQTSPSKPLTPALAYFLSRRMFHCSSHCLANHKIDPKTRAHMVGWMIEVTRVLRFPPSVFFYTIKLMDTFLKLSTRQFQDKYMLLIGITCLYISMKLEEPSLYSLNYLAKNLTQGSIQPSEIIDMETQILHDISFDISMHTSYEVLQELSRYLSIEEVIQHTSMIILYLLVFYYDSCSFDTITLAAASLIISSRSYRRQDVVDSVIELLNLEEDMNTIDMLENSIYLFPRIFRYELSLTKFLKFEFTLQEKGLLFHYVDLRLEEAQRRLVS